MAARKPTAAAAKKAPAKRSPRQPSSAEPATNAAAAEATIGALRAEGRLETIDSARVRTLRSLAAGVDQDPTNASLWREYRAAEVKLREVQSEGTDDFLELLKRLQPTVGDSADTKPADSRNRASRRS